MFTKNDAHKYAQQMCITNSVQRNGTQKTNTEFTQQICIKKIAAQNVHKIDTQKFATKIVQKNGHRSPIKGVKELNLPERE